MRARFGICQSVVVLRQVKAAGSGDCPRDLGLALGSGAYLTALRRVASGEFRVED